MYGSYFILKKCLVNNKSISKYIREARITKLRSLVVGLPITITSVHKLLCTEVFNESFNNSGLQSIGPILDDRLKEKLLKP